MDYKKPVYQSVHYHGVVKLVKEHCISDDGTNYIIIKVLGAEEDLPAVEMYFHSETGEHRIPMLDKNTPPSPKPKKEIPY